MSNEEFFNGEVGHRVAEHPNRLDHAVSRAFYNARHSKNPSRRRFLGLVDQDHPLYHTVPLINLLTLASIVALFAGVKCD